MILGSTGRIVFELVVVCLGEGVTVIIEKVVRSNSKTSIVISNYLRNVVNSKQPKLAINCRKTPIATIGYKGK